MAESRLQLVKNLMSGPKPPGTYKYAYEDPLIMNHEKLRFTSGRKLWKVKHKKRVKKMIRKDKTGFIGA